MKLLEAKPTVGEGIYAVSDIAKILRLPYSKVRYTVDAYIRGKFSEGSDFKYDFEIGADYHAINFYSLIEISVFYALRKENVSARIISECHTALSKYYDTPYPFMKRAIYTDGGKIFFGDSGPMITADKRLQMTFSSFIEPYCAKIQFDAEDLALKYYPLGKGKSVVVNPKNQFGQPTIEGTNIIPEVIYDLYLGGDSIKLISNLYNLSEIQVSDAIEFMQEAA